MTLIDNTEEPIFLGELSSSADNPPPYTPLTNKNFNTYWEMIWEDNFDSATLDNTKWNVMDWAAEKNNELEYYTPDNISLSNDALNVITKRMNYNGRLYTSGAIETKDKFYFLYGKVEVRAKLPSGKGIFPAFWMLPQSESFLPEIDIMEMLGDSPSEIWMVYHWMDSGIQEKVYTSHLGPNYSKDYHTFSIEWNPKEIVWFIDGIRRFSTNHSPDQPMFLYINTAVGGDWPGSPDQTTFLPQSLIVDYIRVYKKI
jgi:beta-glucanase (GH16 family)